jgi:hypothetical protein
LSVSLKIWIQHLEFFTASALAIIRQPDLSFLHVNRQFDEHSFLGVHQTGDSSLLGNGCQIRLLGLTTEQVLTPK